MNRFFLSCAAAAASVCIAVPASAAELVTNGGFETGDFTGWTQSGNTGATLVTSNSAYVHSGTYGAALGPVGSQGTLSQLLNTVSGETYNISFWLRNDGGIPNSFDAFFGTQQLLATAAQGTSAFYNFTYTATGSSPTELRFDFQQNPAFWGLDDVSVQGVMGAVPEPATWAMMLLGFAGIGFAMRRRGSTQALAQVA
jgi:Carbohydrate binding domain/PEP-CTERM motif